MPQVMRMLASAAKRASPEARKEIPTIMLLARQGSRSKPSRNRECPKAMMAGSRVKRLNNGFEVRLNTTIMKNPAIIPKRKLRCSWLLASRNRLAPIKWAILTWVPNDSEEDQTMANMIRFIV